MSCSKLFSGDLPELTYEVIKYLQNDHSTLHSCILVNRLWCRLTIPLLWENPFSISTRNCNFIIDIYLHNSKTELNEYKIINNLLPSNTLFNYLNFLKYLNTYKFITFVKKWKMSTFKNKLLKSSIIEICLLLIKIFIENEVNLHTFEIEIPRIIKDSRYLDHDILELILQNPNFIYNIRNLKFYSIFYDVTIQNRVSQIIKSHQNLKKILLGYDLPLYQSLLLSKDYNFSNTLNTIIFYYVDLKVIINQDKVFEQFNVLEFVHIVYCSSLNNSFIQQIITLIKPFKLRSLFINEILQIESLRLLLQKYGGYLDNFGFGFEFDFSLLLKQQLLELITKYCKNIKFLDLYRIDNPIIYPIINLIENIKQKLNHLTIRISDDTYYSSNGNIGYGSNILQNLGQVLPSKLEYLSLTLSIKENDFRTFLENSQDILINKLLIKQRGSYDILHDIKEYIMEKKRVKYLSIRYYFRDQIDLYDLKDEVEEFKLYNVRVRNWDELSFAGDIYNLLKKVD
ncbi:hypothetical protein RhiirA1_465707 [Rhizophagus irregularis]|uniref:Uncharacterized protein n=1 Tax=Rhizophagus irregularis TaxID=588596 RepID=A0A2I1EAI7_9GLOM|nr:hypothetical protein RhiirA1_465707 [Rhizophagus irregularis]PKY19104.1 hypothetical protein RhiirB3_523269 [Rhizophagus irregularis]